MTKPKKIEECETCTWWDRNQENSNHGHCHVYPPTTDVHGQLPAHYPVTAKDWWCNEFKKDK